MTKALLPTIATLVAAACAPALADPLRGEAARPESKYTDLSDYLLPSQAGKGHGPAPAAGGSGHHFSLVDQRGIGNEAAADLRGRNNSSVQLQYGAGHSSTIEINGANNSLSTLQIGVGNSVELNVQGQNNTIHQSQIGANLSYSLNQSGAGKSIGVHQVGVK